jgi:hypothetical protein
MRIGRVGKMPMSRYSPPAGRRARLEHQAQIKRRQRPSRYARRPSHNHSWPIPPAWRAAWSLRGLEQPRCFRRIACGFEWDYIVSVTDAAGQERRARIATDATPEEVRALQFQRRGELGWARGLEEV